MSVKNFVQCSLVTPVTAAATQLILNPPVAPYDYPPLTAGTVVIADSVARPSFYEVISYTHRIDNVLYGVSRGKEGTTARNWTGTTWVYQALTAADYVAALALKANAANAALTGVPTAPTAAPGTNTNQIATMAAVQAAIAALVQSSPAALDTLNELAAALGNDPNFATTMTAALAGKEPTIVAGTTAQFWAGNKTWQSLMTAVHGLQLTGLGAGSNTAIVTSDTILAALAKLQNQINNKANSNDTRLTDSREWTAATVDQVEAEAGTATTRRAWTAQRIAQAVRGGLLTGLNLTVGTAVTATDTVLVAIGKLQKQVSDLSSNISNSVRAAVLSGFTVGSNASVAKSDSVEAAFGKTQAQINALNTGKLNSGATAAAATVLAASRTFSMTGDVTWTSAGFNGSANVTGVATLANSGVAAGTYGKVTVNAKGLVTAGAALAATDIPALDASKIGSGVIADVRLPSRLRAAAANVTDWDTAIENGWYMASGAANAPTADNSWYMGDVVTHSVAWLWVTQTVTSFTGDSPSNTQTWRRDCNHGTWSEWYRLRLSEEEQSALYLNASNMNAGTLPIARGGTGGATAAAARTALGIGSMATRNVTISTANPSGGVDGDVWFKV